MATELINGNVFFPEVPAEINKANFVLYEYLQRLKRSCESLSKASLSNAFALASGGVNLSTVTFTSTTTITPIVATADIIYMYTTQTAGSTLTLNNPADTPINGKSLIFCIKCSTSQSIAFGTGYRGSVDLGLPTNLTATNKTDYLGFRYNTADSKWDYIAKTFGF